MKFFFILTDAVVVFFLFSCSGSASVLVSHIRGDFQTTDLPCLNLEDRDVRC